MSMEDRITQLEDQAEKLTEPEKQCLFCIDRNKHRFWSVTPITDKLIREYFAKDGIIECNHEEMNEPSIWFADFMAGSLLHYIIDNHIEKQTDEEFKDKTVRDGSIMIPAMEKRMKEQLEEFPLESFAECDRDLIKAKHDMMPFFIETAKRMYQRCE